MSQQVAEYTPLESLFLFQSIASNGVDAGAFARVSEILRSNPLIKADAKFDARRLGPEPLRQLFLVLLRDELKAESDKTEGGGADGTGNASPNARKRKLGSPPLPTLKDVYDNIEKIPILVDRLYARYREHVIRQIREDEIKFDKVQGDIALVERSDRERLVRAAAAAANGSPALAPKDGKQPIPRNVSSPVGGGPSLSQLLKKPPYSTPPVASPRPPSSTTQAPMQPAAAVPSHLAAGAPPVRPSPSPKPQNSPASVLQPPPGVPQTAPRMLQTQAQGQPARQSISPRPDAANNGKATPPKTPATPTSGLKWEKPYVPSQGVQPPAGPQSGPANAAYQQSLAQQQWQQQQQSQQQQKAQATQGQAPPPQAQVHPPTPKPSATQPSGQLQPPLQAVAPKPGSTGPQQQIRPSPAAPTPPRPGQPSPVELAPHMQQAPRPIAAASKTLSPGPGAQSLAAPPQRRPQGQVPPQTQRPAVSPAQVPIPKDKPIATPHNLHPVPRPAIPEHMIRQAAATPPRKISLPPPPAPQTPASTTPGSLMRGFGTRWQSTSTPSTPAPLGMEPESPAFEPVSPPTQPVSLPRRRGSQKVPILQAPPKPEAAKVARGNRASRNVPRRGVSATPSVPDTLRSQSVFSHTDDAQIKDESATPRAADKDTLMRDATPSRVVSRAPKRKRQDTSPASLPIIAPETHVLWTRGFTKVSSSALDQISSHRDANMFAHVIREKNAPGYRSMVLKPQDISSIRQAIKHGNKAALQAASVLPGGDPGSATVWLPISEDLTPPRGIINSAQLERELVHMFCNAIMYNPDPDRGPGPSFLRRSTDEEDEVFGYRLDEHGVVKNTQAMFVEVEKLLGDLRSAEKERSVPPPTGGNTRGGSAVTPAAEEEAEDEERDKDKENDDEGPAGATKRRRIATRG